MKTFVVGDIHGRCAQLLHLLDMLPRDPENDTLVFLGDLIDRGSDAPGCVAHALKLSRENPERVICLRGNHEQMLMDFLEGRSNLWLTPVVGGERTFEQYTGRSAKVDSEKDLEEMRELFAQKFPDQRQLFCRTDERLDLAATRRHFVNDRQIEFPVNRQTKRARNRRCGHDEQMRITSLAYKLLALRHAELVLLVNDDQTEVGNFESLGE